jgi:hypothetical protein
MLRTCGLVANKAMARQVASRSLALGRQSLLGTSWSLRPVAVTSCQQLSSMYARSLSSKKEEPQDPLSEEGKQQAIVLTPGQKVVAGTRLTMWTGIFAFASVCAFYIGKELIPTYVPYLERLFPTRNVLRLSGRAGGYEILLVHLIWCGQM